MTRQIAKLGDRTTSGGQVISASSGCSDNGIQLAVTGDKALCPACNDAFEMMGTAIHWSSMGSAHVATGDRVLCRCPDNQVIGTTTYWVESPANASFSPRAAQAVASAVSEPMPAAAPAKPLPPPVFAKSCLRGDGCNDAGDGQEPHTNFAEIGFFRAAPAADAVTDSDAPQRAQTAKKKKPVAPEDVPEPKKRSALWKWWNGNHEEMDYKMAVAGAAATQRALATTAGANVLEQIGGQFATRGTWAVRAAGIAATGPGAAVAGLLVGMMPGKLNEGEQDFITPILLEQIAAKRGTAPSRVRYTWENDGHGNVVPKGWHTPPGQDGVRVRKMEWDSRYQAYSFTTEEEPRIIIIWTPDSVGMDLPSHTGNQNPVRIPNPIFINPLPEEDGVTAIATPVPEAKTFADYILWTPIEGVPPIYIYLRNNPGQVTGKGQAVSGRWLEGADSDNGSPVPSQIADKLRGRTFANFDQFRQAFWLEVSRDPELSRQFKSGNLGNIRAGKAPAPRESEQVGGKIKYDIHHIHPISEGGDVYNVDNMGIVTPKRHIEIHRGE